jgi:hypothetical protein
MFLLMLCATYNVLGVFPICSHVFWLFSIEQLLLPYSFGHVPWCSSRCAPQFPYVPLIFLTTCTVLPIRPNGSDGCFDKFICMCTNYVPHVFAIEFQPNATFDFSHKHSQYVKSSGSGFKFLLPGPELSSFCWNWHKNQIIKLAFLLDP